MNRDWFKSLSVKGQMFVYGIYKIMYYNPEFHEFPRFFWCKYPQSLWCNRVYADSLLDGEAILTNNSISVLIDLAEDYPDTYKWYYPRCSVDYI